MPDRVHRGRMSNNNYYLDFLRELNSKKFSSLRPAQEQVLREYSDNFKEVRDLAVELPTGAGKTLIALLVGEDWRRRGRKVAILSANKTLARQMLQESEELGIPAVLMEGRGRDIPSYTKRAYQRAQSIGIMNYWVYFNQNPVIDPADLLIMDDAHLAEHCFHSLYSVEITRFEHRELFESLVSELHKSFPEYSVLSDAVDSDFDSNCPPELLSFIDQISALARVQEIVEGSKVLESNLDLHFRWSRMRDRLRQANIYMAKDSLWIRPYIYPVISNEHYSKATQRIYMSATIGDPGDLSRRLGVSPIKKVPVHSDYSHQTVGRRLILMNRVEETDIPRRLGAGILAALGVHPKSVWLCASGAIAAKYKKVVMEWLAENQIEGHPSWILTPEGDEIDEFRQSPKGHLFVGGRFDGMDFSGDECRLVVLTTLPRAINTQEDFISSYLRDSGFIRERLNQRVVQALGRCNRAEEDYAVYVLADRRFASYFGQESNKTGLPKNIIAELDMGQDTAELDESSICERVQSFLAGNFCEYDEQFKQYTASLPAQSGQPDSIDTSADEVLGWSGMFTSENYTLAQQKFEICWEEAKKANLLEIGALHGWHWAKALYLQSLLNDPNARQKSLEVLEAAIQRGGMSAWFNRMRASLNRARSLPVESGAGLESGYLLELVAKFDEFLEQYGATGSRFERRCNRIAELLQSDKHNAYQEGLEELGKLLGYSARRPDYSGAPDCFWKGSFGGTREIVTFEAKVEHSSENALSLSDVGQANNQLAAATTKYGPQGFVVRAIIVTHLSELGPGAQNALGNVKIVSKQEVFGLWARVRSLLTAYRSNWSRDNFAARAQAVLPIQGQVPQAGWLVKALDQDYIFIQGQELLQEWKDKF